VILAACALQLLATVAAIPPGPNIVSVAGAGPFFALTFDAHTEIQGAEALLALLHERGVRVTIFVTGRFAESNPEILARAARDGHEIGNHTWSHPHLTTWAASHRHDLVPGTTREGFQDELRRTAAAIQTAIGRAPSIYWRAPYGEHNATLRAWAAELGLVHVDWTRGERDSLDALDWVESPGQSWYLGPEAIARRLLNFESKHGVPLAGAIVLMHLGSARPAPPLLEALPIFLDETDVRGLKPLPIGELLRRATLAVAPTRENPTTTGAP
jgi:peptidoglycan/xylan/chitin deacetylase (PgdA/CDA1 family)